MAAQDLTTLLDFTKKLAWSAGELILRGSTAILREGNVDEKKNSVDLVTEWDVKVEELVRSEIAKTWPAFNFIGEESFSSGSRPPLTDEPTFCVDPIDGTTNFVHGFPFVCISLGLIYKKQPVLGVIYNPFLDQMYYGLKGQGAFLSVPSSPQPIPLPLAKLRPLPSLSQALLGVEWGSDRSSSVMTRKSDSFIRLAGDGKEIPNGKMAHSLRSIGSAALNYGCVAQGGLDVYWEIGCWPWDVCAGIVIALEAGCYVTGSRDFFLAHRDEDPSQFTDWDEILWGRKYIVIRAIADTPTEKGRDAQRRLVDEFYKSVEEWDAI
ncbi:myo inositol monophosphatase [Gautieria morchelliformis]|nr:myo inositol monophosphatase [Gautieria morchelliformis]